MTSRAGAAEAGAIPTLVYLAGDEPYLAERELRRLEGLVLADADPGLNREVFEASTASPQQVLAAAQTLPFLGGHRMVVVRDAQRWKADAWKVLIPYFRSPNPSTCLVFVGQQFDRRLVALKEFARHGDVIECRKPRDREAAGWARRLAEEAGLRLAPRVLQALALRVGPELQQLAQEVEKLRAFAGEDGSISEQDLEALVGDSRATTVFALCDALGRRELDAALRHQRKLLQLGEPPIRLLYMVVRHFRILWQARELLDRTGRPDRREAAAALGVPPFVVEGVLGQARGWDHPELRRAFAELVEADLRLKTGGGQEVLDGVVVRLCRSAKRPGRGRGAGADKRR